MEIILFIFILCLCIAGAMKYKEGIDSNPMSVTKDQQGDIEYIHKQLKSVTFSEESLKDLLDQVNKQSTQIYKLQISIPDKQVEKYS